MMWLLLFMLLALVYIGVITLLVAARKQDECMCAILRKQGKAKSSHLT